MENFEYSKVFPFEDEEASVFDPGEAETIKNFLHNYEKELVCSPRFLLSYAPAIFEKLLQIVNG